LFDLIEKNGLDNLKERERERERERKGQI